MAAPRRASRGWAALTLLAAAATAQQPIVEIALAAEAATTGLPAIAWLRNSALPMQPGWPEGIDADTSVVVRLDDRGLTIARNSVPLPADALLIGSVDLGRSHRALCTCLADGTEDWFVPGDAKLPPRQDKLARSLRAGDLSRSHTIDLPVAVGHLLGATAEGDTRRELLQIGAVLCGDVTWQAWLTEEHLRVRGRSDGGLLLPAMLLALAAELGNGTTGVLPLRAFVARDGDRAEALRQMARFDAVTDRSTLMAMLHGDDELRLTAIDTLVRLGSSDDLPRIVAAAAPAMPLSSMAAADAVRMLWLEASEATRQATTAALAASQVETLRGLDPEKLPTRAVPVHVSEITSWRTVVWLFVGGIVLFTFWLRERARISGHM